MVFIFEYYSSFTRVSASIWVQHLRTVTYICKQLEALNLNNCFHQIYLCNHPHHHNANVMIYIVHYHNETLQESNSGVLQQITHSVIHMPALSYNFFSYYFWEDNGFCYYVIFLPSIDSPFLNHYQHKWQPRKKRKLYHMNTIIEGRSWVQFQMRSLNFSIDLILPVALWSWGLLSL
jgi:hypothetical protein